MATSRKYLTQRKRGTLRRDQLIAAALKLFSRQGFSATSVGELAAQVGVAKGLIYHHFDTKLDLLHAVIERHAFLPRLRTMLTPMPDEPADVVLLRVARAWWALLKEKRAFILMVFGESQRNPELNRFLGALAQETTSMVARYLASRVRAGELRSELDCNIAARMFMNSLFLFFLQKTRAAPPLRQLAPETYFQQTVCILVEGMRAPVRRAQAPRRSNP